MVKAVWFQLSPKFFLEIEVDRNRPWECWKRSLIFQTSHPSKKSMLPKANKQRKKILNHITLNTLIPHIYFDFLGKGLLTQAVLASEKRDSMHLSVPTLHRNKVKDSCFLQDARIPMTIFLHSLPWDLHLRWCLHLHLWLTRLLRKPIVWNMQSSFLSADLMLSLLLLMSLNCLQKWFFYKVKVFKVYKLKHSPSIE